MVCTFLFGVWTVVCPISVFKTDISYIEEINFVKGPIRP